MIFLCFKKLSLRIIFKNMNKKGPRALFVYCFQKLFFIIKNKKNNENTKNMIYHKGVFGTL